MRKVLATFSLLILILVCGPPAVAQDTPGTVKFPTAIDTGDSLVRASNRAQSSLSVGINSSATTLTVGSASSFPASGAVVIDSEVLFYTGKTSTTLTGLVRGADGTVAASHSAGASVRGAIVAAHTNTLAQAVILTQQKVGSGSSAPATNQVLVGTGTGTSQWGTLTNDMLPSSILNKTFENVTINGATINDVTFEGDLNVGSVTASGTITGTFSGNGAGLTGVIAAGVGGSSSTGALSNVADSDNDGPAPIDFIIGTTTYGRFNATGEFSVRGRGGQMWTPHAQSVHNLAEYASFAAAVDALISTPAVLEYSTTVNISADVTVPSTLTLKRLPGGLLTPATGVTLTVQGHIDAAPDAKVFDNVYAGQGTVSFAGNKGLSLIYGAWFGMLGDGTTDNSPPIQAAIDAVDDADAGLTIKLGRTYSSYYKFDSPVSMDNLEQIVIEGASPGRVGTTDTGGATRSARTELRYTGAGNDPFIHADDSANLTFRNLAIRYTSASFTGDLISLGRTGVSTGHMLDSVLLAGAGGSDSTWHNNAVNSRCLLLLRNNTEAVIQDSVFTLARRAICGRANSAPGVGQSGTGFSNAVTVTRSRFAWIKGHPTLDVQSSVQYGGYAVVQPGTQWNITNNVFELDDDPAGKGRAITTEDVIVRQDASHVPRSINIVGNGFWDANCGGTWLQLRGSGINIIGNFVTLYNGPTITGCGGVPSDGKFLKLYGDSTTQTTGVVIQGNGFDGNVSVSDKSSVYVDTSGIATDQAVNIKWANNGGDTVAIPPPPGVQYEEAAVSALHFYTPPAKTASGAIGHNEGYVYVNAASGNKTYTLPVISPFTGFVKGHVACAMKTDSSANTVTFTGSAGTEKVNGSATSYQLTREGQSVCFISRDGTDWGVAWEGGAGASLSGSNGQLPIGNGSGVTWATLTAGNGLAVTNGAGSITVGEKVRTGAAARIAIPYNMPATSGTVTTDNMADVGDGCKFVRFRPDHSSSVSKVSFRIGTAGATGAVGLYDSAGTTRLAKADSISLAAGSSNNTQTLSATATLDSGSDYVLAWSSSTTAATLLSTVSIAAGTNSFLNVSAIEFGTCTALSSSGVMPSALSGMTAITASADSIPFFVLGN
ncbi:MAG TPA: hypothetical protein VN256_08080 [Pyrinomonadaceae bacterium]|nr:hypothetical protein [Pyrinomonadaceae bacterium]